MFKGYDFFISSPDSIAEMTCRVCGEVCEVERSVSGPTSWAGAMAKKNTIHDEFSCPNGDDQWQSKRRLYRRH